MAWSRSSSAGVNMNRLGCVDAEAGVFSAGVSFFLFISVAFAKPLSFDFDLEGPGAATWAATGAGDIISFSSANVFCTSFHSLASCGIGQGAVNTFSTSGMRGLRKFTDWSGNKLVRK